MRDMVWRDLQVADFNERCWKELAERERRTSTVLLWASGVLGSGAFAILISETGVLAGLPGLWKALFGCFAVAVIGVHVLRLKDDPATRSAEVHASWVRIHGGWRAAWARVDRGDDVADAITQLYAQQAEAGARGSSLRLSARRQKVHFEAMKAANAYD